MPVKRNQKNKTTRHIKVERSFQPALPLKPKNYEQEVYISAINRTPITIATGYPGTGKTYLPARIAAQWLKKGEVDRIVLVRPALSTSESLGFFKGTKEEKMKQWVSPILGALKEEFSPGSLEYMMKEDIEQIVFCPLETVKGNSFKDAFIIIDEAEDCSLKEIKSLVTRIGTKSRMVLCGDIDQTDLKNSGLVQFLEMRKEDETIQQYVAHINFDDPDSIVRSKTCREMILGFERFGK